MTIEFTMTTRKGVQYTAIIDDSDADLLKTRWCTQEVPNTVYVKHSTPRPKQRSESMHSVIMARMLGRKLEHHEEVDHIDRNGLNNTRSNLRIATVVQNQANARISKSNTTGFKGVRKHKGKFMARISVNGNRLFLGMFATPELAHAAYMEAAIKYHGEFARGE